MEAKLYSFKYNIKNLETFCRKKVTWLWGKGVDLKYFNIDFLGYQTIFYCYIRYFMQFLVYNKNILIILWPFPSYGSIWATLAQGRMYEALVIIQNDN